MQRWPFKDTCSFKKITCACCSRYPCFWLSLLIEMGKKAFSSSISGCQVPEALLLSSGIAKCHQYDGLACYPIYKDNQAPSGIHYNKEQARWWSFLESEDKLFSLSCECTTILRLKECLIWYRLWPRNSIYNEESTSVSPCYGIHCSYHMSHHPK